MTIYIALCDIDLVDENGHKAYVVKLMIGNYESIADPSLNQCSLSKPLTSDHTSLLSNESFQNTIHKESKEDASEFDEDGNFFSLGEKQEKNNKLYKSCVYEITGKRIQRQPVFFGIRHRPRTTFKQEAIGKEIGNQSVRKGALKDAFAIPPHVLFPFSHSINCFTFETYPAQRQTMLPVSGNILAKNFTRLGTFSTWPHNAPYSALRLAEAGFLYDRSSSTIKCHFCGIQVECTRQIHEFHRRNMTVIQIHRELNSDCEHAKNMEQLKAADNGVTDSSKTSVVSNINNITITQETSNADNHCNDQESDNSINSESNYISNINHSESSIQNVSDSEQIALLDNIHTESNSNGAMVPQHSLCSSQNAIMPELINQKNNPKISQVNFETNFASSINEENEIYALKHPHFKSVTSRLETYRSWQIPEIQDPKVLTEAGFYFTGNRDIVRCFCCDIRLAEWEDSDDPWFEHARHSPSCEYLQQKRGHEYINSVQTEWKKIYNPKHPEFNETQARLDSFVGWPQELNQRPDVLAAAGFFFTGQNDSVRCHYCDGRFMKWEPQDDPWIEHAHWFPFCKYLIKIKGPKFIEEVAMRNYSEAMSAVDEREEDYYELTTNQQGPVDGTTLESSDTIQQLFDDRLENNADPLSTTAAETLMCMGYTRNNVQYVINLFIRENGQRSFNAEDLLDIIMDMEDRNEQFPVQSDFNSGSSPYCQNNPDSGNITRLDLEAENRHLKSQMLCIICKEKDRNMILIPCGHRVFCEQCSSNVKRCPICHKNAKKKVKVFIV